MMKPPKFKPQIVYATWRGPGWVPCLWSASYQDVCEQQDHDEYVIKVKVQAVRRKRRPRAPHEGTPDAHR